MADVRLLTLPDDAIFHIFQWLDFRDISRCCLTCHRLQALSKHDAHWKYQCKKYWQLTSRPEDVTWWELWRLWYQDFGRYINVYKTIRGSWDAIEAYMSTRLPAIHQSLQDGASEEHLDTIERQMGISFPDDLRCSYRIHNGQSIADDGVGLFGFNTATASLYENKISEYIMPLSHTLYNKKETAMQGCYRLTAFFDSSNGLNPNINIALSDEAGFTQGNILLCDRNPSQEKDDAFVFANSFQEWFNDFAQHFQRTNFLLIDGKLYKDFYQAPDCVATTNFITVSVATAFLPQFSTIDHPYFFYTYRITMSMSPDAPMSESCQLETRHWVITNERGEEETVDGPGVVGEYPEMKPGASYSWISFTNFPTTYGNMSGYLTMRNMVTGARVDVKCPTFHMKCYPYETRKQRDEKRLRRKKDQ